MLVIRFNKQGIVQKIERLNKQDGRKVKIVDRKTPTRGKGTYTDGTIIGECRSL